MSGRKNFSPALKISTIDSDSDKEDVIYLKTGFFLEHCASLCICTLFSGRLEKLITIKIVKYAR